MMVVSPMIDNGVGTNNLSNRQASCSPVSTFLLYQSNLDVLPHRDSSLFSPSPLIDKGVVISSPMPHDYPSQMQKFERHPRADSAGGISRAWTTSHNPCCSFSNSRTTLLGSSVGTASASAFAGLTSVSTPSIGFNYSTPATAAISFPSPGFLSTEQSNIHQSQLVNDFGSGTSATSAVEHHLLPSPASHDSPNSFPNYNLSVHPSPKPNVRASNSPLTHSDLAPSNSSSRSWTPDQPETSQVSSGYTEFSHNSHQFAPLGSPATIEQPASFFRHHCQASPPGSGAHYPDSVPRGLIPSQPLNINPSDPISDGQASLVPRRSHYHEETETFLPSPAFSPGPTDIRPRLNKNHQELCSPLTPLSLDPPGLGLMNTPASFGIPPTWFESEIFPPIDPTQPQSDYDGNSNSRSYLSPRNISMAGDSLLQTQQVLASKFQTQGVSPMKFHPPLTSTRFLVGEDDENGKSLCGPSGQVGRDPVMQLNSPRVTGCNKKKKREVRELEAACGLCGERMARLTLRGSPEELHVADGFDVVHTCKPCQEGRSGGNFAAGGQIFAAVPFSEKPITQSDKDRPTGVRPEVFPQATVTTFRKRNRRTDDVTAPTTCDCCARQLGVGGIVPRNGRSAIQFAVEVVCIHCVNNFRRCTDCGGGGGSRLGVGKWRCKELFSDGRRTCILSHQRQGASTEIITTVWRVRQLVGKPELDTLVGQLRELVKHSLYAALATPEMLESGLARVSTFDDVKTLYANGWKQIQPLIIEEVENELGRRRYVGLRWTKPHPRKGPKRVALLNNCDQAPTAVRHHDLLLEPGKELSGFVLCEWDMPKGTFFVSVAMPWQSGDALESTAALAHKSFVEAKIDRELLIDDLVSRGTDRREASLRYPPIRHLWTILFFHREARLVQFLEKRRKFMPLEDYLTEYPDAHRDMFPPRRDCYLPLPEQKGWSVWVRREGGNRSTTLK